MKKDVKSQLETRKPERKYIDYKWILQLTLLAFSISLTFSFVTEMALGNTGLLISVIAVILFIVVAVIFDIIAIAITTADEAPFHSMSSRKMKAGKVAIKLKKNAAKLTSIFSDVIGDICGIVSGTAAVYIAVHISEIGDLSFFPCMLVTTAVITSMTISAKALEKSFALEKNNYILYYFANCISIFFKDD